MCDFTYDDPVKVYREAPRTAHKAHSCAGCGATIRKSEAYCYVSYVGDGTARSEHECFSCWWTRTDFCLAHAGGPLPSVLREELQSCVADGDVKTWRPHLAALKRRWRTSPTGRRQLARRVFRNALIHELWLTRLVLRKRIAS